MPWRPCRVNTLIATTLLSWLCDSLSCLSTARVSVRRRTQSKEERPILTWSLLPSSCGLLSPGPPFPSSFPLPLSHTTPAPGAAGGTGPRHPSRRPPRGVSGGHYLAALGPSHRPRRPNPRLDPGPGPAAAGARPSPEPPGPGAAGCHAGPLSPRQQEKDRPLGSAGGLSGSLRWGRAGSGEETARRRRRG